MGLSCCFQSAELPSSPTQVIRLVQSNMKACQYLEAIVMIDHALGCGGFDKEILSELHRLRGVCLMVKHAHEHMHITSAGTGQTHTQAQQAGFRNRGRHNTQGHGYKCR